MKYVLMLIAVGSGVIAVFGDTRQKDASGKDTRRLTTLGWATIALLLTAFVVQVRLEVQNDATERAHREEEFARISSIHGRYIFNVNTARPEFAQYMKRIRAATQQPLNGGLEDQSPLLPNDSDGSANKVLQGSMLIAAIYKTPISLENISVPDILKNANMRVTIMEDKTNPSLVPVVFEHDRIGRIVDKPTAELSNDGKIVSFSDFPGSQVFLVLGDTALMLENALITSKDLNLESVLLSCDGGRNIVIDASDMHPVAIAPSQWVVWVYEIPK